MQEEIAAQSDFPDASSCSVTDERGCCFVASSKKCAEGMVDAVGHFRVTDEGYEYCPPVDVERAACPNGLEEMKTALAALSARTGAEVTAVFHGAEVAQVPATRHPRGVRVVFSDRGEIADQRIRLLVAAEPLGRLLLIASNDKEVAVAANRPGGRAVASGALLRALGE